MKKQKKSNQSICRILIFLAIIIPSFAVNKPVLAAFPGSPEITKIYPPEADDATVITTTSFQANWSSVTGASGYKLVVSKSIGKDLWSVLPNYNNISVSGTSLVVTGLSAGTRYAYAVRSVSLTELLPSDPSNIIEVATTPEPPVATAATSITDNSFVANWNASTGASSYKLYVQYRQYIPITQTYIWRSTTGYESGVAVTGTSYTVLNLSHSTNYRYCVKAIGSSAESDYSNWIDVQTLLGATVATAATDITATSFTANWESQTWADSYTVMFYSEPSHVYFDSRVVETNSVNLKYLSTGTSYSYNVKVKSGELSSPYSNSISVTTIPPAPVAITEDYVSHNSFTAQWNAAQGATSYLLRVVDNSTQEFILLDYETTNLSADVSGLNPNSSYQYAVMAKNSSGLSEISNWIVLTTKLVSPVLNQPTNITTNSISLSWSAVSEATGYNLYYRDSDPRSFRYQLKTLGNITEYTLTGLDFGEPYDIYVVATNTNVASLRSNTLFDVYTALGAPVANEATNVTATSFQANWTGVVDATAYKLLVYEPGMIRGSWVVMSEFDDYVISGTEFNVTGLSPNSGYRYGVKSVIGSTSSVVSNYILVTTTDALPVQYAVSLSALPSTMGSVSGGGTFNSGASVTITATPSSALYRFVNWTEGASVVSSDASYTFNISGNRTLVANFEAVPTTTYTVGLSALPSTMGSVSGGGTFNSGASVTITATPSSALYRFVNWTEGASVVSSSASYTFNISGNRTLVANFEVVPTITYTVGLSASPSTMGSVSGGGTFNSGASVTVTATPSSALYRFVNWTEGASVVSSSASYTFNISGNRTLVANFEVVPTITYTVGLSASPAEGGTVEGEGTFNSGASVTVTATSEDGYDFTNWTEGGSVVSSAESYTFTINKNRELIANFAEQVPNTFTVALTASPAEGGTVEGEGTFESGASVTVTATPDDGYDFTNWTEGGRVVSSAESYTFTINKNRELIANFEEQVPNTFTVSLTASPAEGGTVEGEGTFESGASVTVTATPDDGYDFVNWTEGGRVVSSAESYTFTINKNRELIANFEEQVPNTFTVALTALPSEGGTVEGEGTFNSGASVTVTATPEDGYDFTNWTEGGSVVSSAESYTFTSNKNRELIANFAEQVPNTFTVDLTATPAEGGTVEGEGTFNSGASVTVTATPEDGYDFTNWTEGGSVVSSAESYTFTINKNRELIANFEEQAPNTFTVDLTATPAEGGTVEGEGTFESGASVTVTATPDDGYDFINWTEGGRAVSSAESYSFTINKNRELIANFEEQAPNTFTVSLTASPAEGGTVEGEGTFESGASVTVTATPDDGYDFVNWTEGGRVVSSAESYTFTINKNRELIANFAEQVPNTFTVDLTATPAEGGTVEGEGTFESGASVTVTATPDDGYDFVNWTEGGRVVSSAESYTFTSNKNRELIANFELKEYTITLSANPSSGGFTNFVSNQFAFGQNVTVNANQNSNYTFVSWTENGVIVSTNKSFTFTAEANRSLVANFIIETGAEDINEITMLVYPNPTTGIVHVSGISEGAELNVSDLSGRIIHSVKAGNSTEILDLSRLRHGVYFIRIDDKQFHYTKRVVLR